jgi:hypothetical protein
MKVSAVLGRNVIRLALTSAKFVSYTVVGLNGTAVEGLKLKYAVETFECAYLASTSVPYRHTTLQIPNLAFIETKRIYSVRVNSLQYIKTKRLLNRSQ